METKQSQDFTTSILVEQSPQEVFNAVTNVRTWWSRNITRTTDKLNGEFKVDFEQHWWAFRIIELLPDERVVWYVTGSYMPWNKNETEWTDTQIRFDIAKRDSQTELLFTHIGLTPSSDCFEGCSKGWTGYMHKSLKALIKTGNGTPDTAY